MSGKESRLQDQRFSGHESFSCRYGWLPKFAHAITDDPSLFEDDEEAMLHLGIGRNMVRSIRFWAEAFGIATGDRKGRYKLTKFGNSLLHPKNGSDPYLEDDANLWLLHWIITTRGRLGAWLAAFDDQSEPEIERAQFEALVARRSESKIRSISLTTIQQHCDVFLRTYASEPYGVGRDENQEESLGAPFQELGLLDIVERSGRSVIRFNRGLQRGLSVPVYAAALVEFWNRFSPASKTLPLLSAAADTQSPGRVFKLTLSATAILTSSLAELHSDYLSFEDDTVRSGLVLKEGVSLSELEDVVGMH